MSGGCQTKWHVVNVKESTASNTVRQSDAISVYVQPQLIAPAGWRCGRIGLVDVLPQPAQVDHEAATQVFSAGLCLCPPPPPRQQEKLIELYIHTI